MQNDEKELNSELVLSLTPCQPYSFSPSSKLKDSIDLMKYCAGRPFHVILIKVIFGSVFNS